ncbi:transmembrane protease serine 9-like [Hemibagrus wyckioides]|uniref:transmembrane protease serine 9-like n=1 Tax=Hemibagrus wyckioides TaxID=337641 RepID=UPI00266BBA1C|nr:transmembrane protease serine 9-like [Hemibagrus wyckioides]
MFFSISLLVLSVLHLCGAMEGGIIGGREAKPHSRPYMVSVQINNMHTCGGVLIKKDYVLTAAHCVNETEYPGKVKLEVVLGAHNISEKERQQQRIQVQKFIKHPCYKRKENQNDIMLLKLESKAKLNEVVEIIHLPKKNEKLPAKTECSIAGWGRTSQNSGASDVLREVMLKVQDNSQCKKSWQHNFDIDNMICTAPDGKKAFCKGDSGSPLICGNEPQGLAAYTHYGNCLNYPEVYMKITYFLPWIKEIIGSLSVWYTTDMFFSISLLVLSVLHLCGAMESGIIGGKEAKPHSRPYMVSVQVNSEHKCGGMLIKEDYVLSAAHCVNETEYPGKVKLEVVLGAHNINKKERQQQRIQVQKFIKHPCYKRKENQNDIMLLKLESKAKLNKDVQIIHLPKKNEKLPAKTECSIAGWGRTSQNSAASDVLREVTLKVQDNSQCKKLWQQYFDTDSMICTAPDGKDAFCQGDSGSPLICGNKPQGLAAYTYPDDCLNRKYPEVYTKISYYLPWIKEIIG